MQTLHENSIPARPRNIGEMVLTAVFVVGLCTLVCAAISSANLWYLPLQAGTSQEPLGGGGMIAYTARLEGGVGTQIRIYDVASRTDRLVYEDEFFKSSYVWMPDNSALLFQNDRVWPPSPIMSVDPAGGEPLFLSQQDYYTYSMPAVSPDGHNVAFCSDRLSEEPVGNIYDEELNIFILNLDNGRITHPPVDFDNVTAPAWSPDGTKIAIQVRIDDQYDIFVVDADGSNPVNLTNHSANDLSPAWSPDGKQIAFLSDRSGGSKKLDIYLMSFDGSNPRNLTRTPEVSELAGSWSPDGGYMVFSIYTAGVSHLYFLDIATHSIWPVPVQMENACCAVWSHGSQP